jgi:hypothetical protein
MSLTRLGQVDALLIGIGDQVGLHLLIEIHRGERKTASGRNRHPPPASRNDNVGGGSDAVQDDAERIAFPPATLAC